MKLFEADRETLDMLRKAWCPNAPRLDVSASFGPVDYSMDFDRKAARWAVGERSWMAINSLAVRKARNEKDKASLPVLVLPESDGRRGGSMHLAEELAFAEPVAIELQREFGLNRDAAEASYKAIQLLSNDFRKWVDGLPEPDKDTFGLEVKAGEVFVVREPTSELLRRQYSDRKPFGEQ